MRPLLWAKAQLAQTSPLFERAIKVVLWHEGGLSDDPDDPGGITNFGITLPWLHNFEPEANRDTILIMTKDQARDRYFKYLWTPFGADRLSDSTVATKIFDAAVQFGEFSAHEPGHEGSPALAQLAANKSGAGLVVDGHLGPKSLWAINNLDPRKYVNDFCDLMLERYKASVQRNPKSQKYLDGGWAERAAWPNPYNGRPQRVL